MYWRTGTPQVGSTGVVADSSAGAAAGGSAASTVAGSSAGTAVGGSAAGAVAGASAGVALGGTNTVDCVVGP